MRPPLNRTGELLFSRYAYPCAWGRMVSGKISRKHYDELTAHANNGTFPNRQLLRFCYPHAFRRLREFANEISAERWAEETVSKFWRNRHGHQGDCRVLSCAVVKANGSDSVLVVDEDENIFKVINLYRIPVKPLDTVYTHLRVIIEKE